MIVPIRSVSAMEEYTMALKKTNKEKTEKKVGKKNIDAKAMLSGFSKKNGKKNENGLKSGGKQGISSQIQSRIGKSVILVLLVIAVIATFMVNNIVQDANDTELKLESQLASKQISEFFAPFQTMTTQLAVNPELQLLMQTTSMAKNLVKHSGYPDALTTIQQIQDLDVENINAVWFADVDANVIATSSGYISDESWDIYDRPWSHCLDGTETIYTVPFLETTTGKEVVTIATPMYDAQQKVFGVSGMDIAIDVIKTTLAE